MASIYPHPFATSPSPPPHTSKQWKLVLQRVKLLYAQRQYKQCAAQVEEIIMTARKPVHPVYKTYLYYYGAISYEILGHAAHDYSNNKPGLLHSALDCFITCSAVLPSIITVPEFVVGGEAEAEEEYSSDASLVDDSSSPWDSPDSSFMECPLPATGPGGSLVSDLTRIIDDSMEWGEEDPFISDSGVHSTATSDSGVVPSFKLPREDSSKNLLMPSPLQIRKSSGTLGSAYGEAEQSASNQSGRSRRPPPLPIKIVPYKEAGIPVNTQKHREHINTSESSIVEVDELTRTSIKRYNNSIQFLRTQITTCIASTQALIDEITQLQRARKASKTLRRAASFWSFSPVSKPGADMVPDEPESGAGLGTRAMVQQQQESKEERIARLRAEGWETVGVKSRARGWKGAEYYKAYCNMVLDELYLDGTQ